MKNIDSCKSCIIPLLLCDVVGVPSSPVRLFASGSIPNPMQISRTWLISAGSTAAATRRRGTTDGINKSRNEKLAPAKKVMTLSSSHYEIVGNVHDVGRAG